MNRRKFFKSLVIGVTAVVVAPKLLTSKPKLDGYTVAKPMIHGVKDKAGLYDTIPGCGEVIAYDVPGINKGTFWITFDDWQATNHWYKTQEEVMFERMQKYLTK